MPLFKAKPAEAPPADPPPADPPADETKFVSQEAFNAVTAQLTEVTTTLKAMQQTPPAYQQPQAPVAPVEDPHKETKDRIAAIDKQLDDLATKADEASYSGKGMGDVMRHQNSLMQERSTLQGQLLIPTSDPRIEAGITTIDALSTELTSSKMPHLTIPEVKVSFDGYIAQLTPEQRMNPKAKLGAYNLAVGENLPKIEEVNRQAYLRETEDPPTQDGGGTGQPGRVPPAADGAPPTPETILSDAALKSIKGSRHHTPDNYYRSLGYEGWDDYYEKNKEYLEEEE